MGGQYGQIKVTFFYLFQREIFARSGAQLVTRTKGRWRAWRAEADETENYVYAIALQNET